MVRFHLHESLVLALLVKTRLKKTDQLIRSFQLRQAEFLLLGFLMLRTFLVKASGPDKEL